MAIRDDFTAGEVLAAADLNDTFASKVPYAYGTATPSTTVDGFVWYDENETPPAPKFWDGAAFQALGGGKVLQVVRATDTTNRSTTSTSYVDVTGMSITITPTAATSTVILISYFLHESSGTVSDTNGQFVLTDSANNIQDGSYSWSGTQNYSTGTQKSFLNKLLVMTLVSPATVSAVTYKLRMKSGAASTTTNVYNGLASAAGQMYAIEVSA